MRDLYVAVLVLLFVSTVTAGGYGHRRKHHANIYGHNIIRTFPTHQQYSFGGQTYFENPIQNRFQYVTYQNPVITAATVPFQGNSVITATGIPSSFANGAFTGTIGTTGVLLQHPPQNIYPSQTLRLAYPSTPVVPGNVGSPGMTFLSGATQSVPFQSPGTINLGTQSITAGGIPVSPLGTTIQTSNGPFPSSTLASPVGITTGSTIIQNGAAGGIVPFSTQPTSVSLPTSSIGNIQNGVAFQDVGFNLPVTSNSAFDSVPQAYEQEQNGLKTGVPTLGNPFNVEEKVGIPEFGGWAPPVVNDIVIREDNALPTRIQHRSLASILRKFHMK
ncbi:uncharacterized protein LOC132552870 [Ylistrum balloti]|uniref:uncharacterized protein LOC132552870 n=1 Tax=Ylistrum balloti TaxID=509963 RepID=UPI0029057F12|nr:uncharacterized protein LOC132552870 [Ylistrum balloti]